MFYAQNENFQNLLRNERSEINKRIKELFFLFYLWLYGRCDVIQTADSTRPLPICRHKSLYWNDAIWINWLSYIHLILFLLSSPNVSYKSFNREKNVLFPCSKQTDPLANSIKSRVVEWNFPLSIAKKESSRLIANTKNK